ncbi:hypothetical protein HDU91_006893 [Kappamyces sp. JEL0680]|nr:hypothetical protein HDU91_006893 [Kappamyces sp. JEL0680]
MKFVLLAAPLVLSQLQVPDLVSVSVALLPTTVSVAPAVSRTARSKPAPTSTESHSQTTEPAPAASVATALAALPEEQASSKPTAAASEPSGLLSPVSPSPVPLSPSLQSSTQSFSLPESTGAATPRTIPATTASPAAGPNLSLIVPLCAAAGLVIVAASLIVVHKQKKQHLRRLAKERYEEMQRKAQVFGSSLEQTLERTLDVEVEPSQEWSVV